MFPSLSSYQWKLVGTGLVVLVVSEVLHEMLRARAANLMGDPTPRSAGCLTWRPWRFIDPIMTVVLPGLLLYGTQGQLLFGGARPTPIKEERMRWPRLGGLVAHGAGPLANLAVAAGCGYLHRQLGLLERSIPAVLLLQGVLLNCFLIVWHCLPFPGTNVGYMIRVFLPNRGKALWDGLQSHMLWIVILLFFLSPAFMGKILYLRGELQDWLL